MTDQPPPSPQGSFFQQQGSRPLGHEPIMSGGDDERVLPIIVYVLYLLPLGITHIVGLVMAYVARESAPAWLRSHYTFQIRTFWIGLLYAVITGLLCLVFIGFLLVPFLVIWFVVRCAVGLVRLSERRAYPNPQSWTI